MDCVSETWVLEMQWRNGPGLRQVEQGVSSFLSKFVAKNEENPCSTCLLKSISRHIPSMYMKIRFRVSATSLDMMYTIQQILNSEQFFNLHTVAQHLSYLISCRANIISAQFD